MSIKIKSVVRFYVGVNRADEWTKYSVYISTDGICSVSMLYTLNKGEKIALLEVFGAIKMHLHTARRS